MMSLFMFKAKMQKVCKTKTRKGFVRLNHKMMISNVAEVVLVCTRFCVCDPDQGPGVDGVAVQQQPERYPCRRDGAGQDHPDHRPHHVSHGDKEGQRTFPHHRTTLVRPLPS